MEAKNDTPGKESLIPKAYDAKLHEAEIYEKWEKSGKFSPKKGKKSFSIIMPPPNATGTLHLGHAVMLALEDIMARYHRMKGDATLWIPGTDHAAIATQNKVEKDLAQKGITRFDLGRKDFIQEVEKFVKKSQTTIRNQVRKMGSSCDWSRETYTLDPGPSLAVRTVFKRMYDQGLIYRGNRIVNWCPRCQSTLADDEVKYKETRGKFYYLKYGPFTIGTARPETKFLDKVVVVHPDDKRYRKYVGKTFDVPWIEGTLKATVIADKASDPAFGSGVMTITPAHSHIDFEIAQRHKLEIVKIIDENGNLTEHAGKFAGMNATIAREKIIENLNEKGLVEKIDDQYVHNLSVCYRCDSTIEPLTSTQWFINVDKKIPKRGKTMKQLSIEVVKKGKIKILPEKFEKIYAHWMGELHDWCISRQIWFGHQIPVWYCKNCNGKPMVEIETPTRCSSCAGSELTQDPDVLDTWFSSGLWTFSTLGWPKKTPDLKTFHPTSVLETGYDILFFWVARMIIMTTYALNEVPFKTVYLHGLVRTRSGEKMSKSKPESCIDPLDMIEKYGADALRLSMVIGSTPGNDTRLYEEKIAGYRNFVNKIWNAARFILLNTNEKDLKKKFTKSSIKSTADKWILTRLQYLIKDTTRLIENYNFSEAGTQIYDFLWSDLCDWYIEFSKGKDTNPEVLIHALKETLKLLHPFVPFVTEVLWGMLQEKDMIMVSPWPVNDSSLVFPSESKKIEKIHAIIGELRRVKAEYKIDPAKKINAIIYGQTLTELLQEKKSAIIRLANLEALKIEKKGPEVSSALHIAISGIEVYLPLEGMFDIEKEKERITKELELVKREIAPLEGRLKNKGFTANAPVEVVQQAKTQLLELQEREKKLKQHQQSLEKA